MIKECLVCVAVVVLFGCSQSPGTNTAVAQQNALSGNTNISPGNSNAPVEKKVESPVKPLGTFMNVKTSGEHASGYLLQLWKQDDKVYGLISSSQGLMGDPPTGSLENAQLDSKTGKLSFKAKLSLGLYMSKDSPDAPSRDVFEFEGTWTEKKVEGTLKTTNQLCPDKCPETKKISLPRSEDWSSGMKDYPNYAGWKSFADEILDRRGPNWE
jgi:hypothetical protein